MTIPNPSLWNPFHAISSKTLPKFMFLTVKCLYLSPWYHAYFILVPPCARKYQIQGWPKTCPQIKFSLSKNYFLAQSARDKVKDKDKVIFVAPRCFHEHLDIFTEVEKPDTQNLIETPFGGRWTQYKEKLTLTSQEMHVWLYNYPNLFHKVLWPKCSKGKNQSLSVPFHGLPVR